MPDSLKQVLIARNKTKLLGGPQAHIGEKPAPSTPRKLLELVTGYPADPDRNMGPMDAIQMLLIGLGAGKGLQMGYKALLNGPSAAAGHAIKNNPYGLVESPTGRRGFMGRMIGNDYRRAEKADRATWREIDTIDKQLSSISENAGDWSPENPLGWKMSNSGGIRKHAPTEKELYNRQDELMNLSDELIDRLGRGHKLLDEINISPQKIADAAAPLKQLSPEIAKDPYGVSPTPSRRQFFDRLAGNPLKKANAEMDRASAVVTQQTGSAPPQTLSGEFENWLSDSTNRFKKVVSPEAYNRILRQSETFDSLAKQDEIPGPITTIFNALKSRLRGR